MKNVIKNFESAADKDLVGFVRDVLRLAQDNQNNNAIQKMNHDMGKVSEREATGIVRTLMNNGIKNVPDNLTEFSHNLNGGQLKHISVRHGECGAADQTMADINDIGRLRYVIDNYDSIELSRNKKGEILYNNRFRNNDNTPSPIIIYKKRVNGDFIVVEAVPDSKNKQLQIISAYKSDVPKEI